MNFQPIVVIFIIVFCFVAVRAVMREENTKGSNSLSESESQKDIEKNNINLNIYFTRHLSKITWIILTIVYLVGILVGGGEGFMPSNVFIAAIGLFVPSGFWVTFITWGLSLLVVGIIMSVLDNSSRDKSVEKRFIITLSVLAILTNIADLLLFGGFISYQLFFSIFGLVEEPHFGL